MAKRTSFNDWNCSVAQTVEIIGEVWTPLILRDLFWGVNRFDDLVEDLGISRNILADRLKTLTAAGVVQKAAYQERPVRHRYLLTEAGRDLWPVLASLLAWGDKWAAQDDGPPVLLRHETCEQDFHTVPTCSECGGTVEPEDVAFDFRGNQPSALGTCRDETDPRR